MRPRSFAPLLAVAGVLGFAACRSGPLPVDDGGVCPTYCSEALNIGGVPIKASGPQYDSYVQLLCCASSGAAPCCGQSSTTCDLGDCNVPSDEDSCDAGSATDCSGWCGSLIAQHTRASSCCLHCLQTLCPSALAGCLNAP